MLALLLCEGRSRKTRADTMISTTTTTLEELAVGSHESKQRTLIIWAPLLVLLVGGHVARQTAILPWNVACSRLKQHAGG